MNKCRYVYAYSNVTEDGEAFFRFPKFENIFSSLDEDVFKNSSEHEIADHAHDAVITALQGIILTRDEIPQADDPSLTKADRFVHLRVGESMKLELYKLYLENCSSVADFARLLNKQETAAHRLLDLRHNSKASEIEKVIAFFGKRLVHDWSLEAA